MTQEEILTNPDMNDRNALDLLKDVYHTARIAEAVHNGNPRDMNLPLIMASRLERPFRRLFLDDEAIAREAHNFFTEYAKRNPEVLTRKAQAIVSGLEDIRDGIYIVELNVPRISEGIHRHRNVIDLVSFLPIKNTLRVLDAYIVEGNINHFGIAHQKGNLENRYWSTRSDNREVFPDKTEETLVILRKRVHGTGYSLREEMVNNLRASGWTSNTLWAFAE